MVDSAPKTSLYVLCGDRAFFSYFFISFLILCYSGCGSEVLSKRSEIMLSVCICARATVLRVDGLVIAAIERNWEEVGGIEVKLTCLAGARSSSVFV